MAAGSKGKRFSCQRAIMIHQPWGVRRQGTEIKYRGEGDLR